MTLQLHSDLNRELGHVMALVSSCRTLASWPFPSLGTSLLRMSSWEGRSYSADFDSSSHGWMASTPTIPTSSAAPSASSCQSGCPFYCRHLRLAFAFWLYAVARMRPCLTWGENYCWRREWLASWRGRLLLVLQLSGCSMTEQSAMARLELRCQHLLERPPWLS